MRVFVPCMECLTSSDLLYGLELNDDFILKLTCEKGHDSITRLQEHKFEILFEVGANAVLDGYHREAITAFQASLERFYEFFITVIAIKHGVDKQVAIECWKDVSRQSERQLGAFIYLYALEYGSKPPILPQPMVELRNDVIHKGKIASRDEAVRYGNAVLAIINPLLKDMKSRLEPHVMEAIKRNVERIGAKAPTGVRQAFMCTGSIISLALAGSEPHPDRLEPQLERLMRKREKHGTGI